VVVVQAGHGAAEAAAEVVLCMKLHIRFPLVLFLLSSEMVVRNLLRTGLVQTVGILPSME
jgi:hypothetical protein